MGGTVARKGAANAMSLKKKILLLLFFSLTAALALGIFLMQRLTQEILVRENLEKLREESSVLAEILAREGVDSLRRTLSNWKWHATRITCVDAEGNVLFDMGGEMAESNASPSPKERDNHLRRPEIAKAFEKGEGRALRYSQTLKLSMHYFARRVTDGNNAYVLRLATPIAALSGVKRAFVGQFFATIAGAGALIFLFSYWLTAHFFRPLEQVASMASRIAESAPASGNATRESLQFPLFKDPELQKLSVALNEMSRHLRQSVDDIQARREEMSQIVESLPLGVLLIDRQSRVRYSGAMARRLLAQGQEIPKGTAAERFLPGELDPSSPEPQETLKTFALADGMRIILFEKIPISSGSLVLLRDLTREKDLEQARRHFVIDAGHELQTPLAAIRAAAELLRENTQPGSEEDATLETLIRQQERMTALVDDLLLLVKLDDPDAVDPSSEFDLSALVASLLDEQKSLPQSQRIRFEFQGTPGVIVHARRAELRRAFENIVDNSVKHVLRKFGSRDGGHVSVTLETLEDGRISLLFEDNGPGIDAEKRSRIFEQFYRADSSRARNGTARGGYGLGLSIAHRIVVRHGGTIALEPTGEGAAFRVLLPRGKA